MKRFVHVLLKYRRKGSHERNGFTRLYKMHRGTDHLDSCHRDPFLTLFKVQDSDRGRSLIDGLLQDHRGNADKICDGLSAGGRRNYPSQRRHFDISAEGRMTASCEGK